VNGSASEAPSLDPMKPVDHRTTKATDAKRISIGEFPIAAAFTG
jgi:hypothetical protein